MLRVPSQDQPLTAKEVNTINGWLLWNEAELPCGSEKQAYKHDKCVHREEGRGPTPQASQSGPDGGCLDRPQELHIKYIQGIPGDPLASGDARVLSRISPQNNLWT